MKWYLLSALAGIFITVGSVVMQGCNENDPEPTDCCYYWDAREILDTWQYTHDVPGFNSEQIFTSGLYSWRTFIPSLKEGEKADVGAWIYCDDHHAVDFAVGWGSGEERRKAHCLPGEVLAYMTNRDGPYASDCVPVSTGWHEFALRLDVVDGLYEIHWIIDGREKKHQMVNFGLETAFRIGVGGDSFQWVKFQGSTRENAKPSNYSDYKLDWADEFDVDGKPDPRKWGFEEGFVRNKEVQWYQRENAYCKDGCLVLEARVEHKRNPNYVEGSSNWKTSREYIEYTSASLQTEGLKEFLYGAIEFRARIPVDQAAWPAIWTTGTTMPWPYNGEMDMMEFYRRAEGATLFANFFWTGSSESDVRDNTSHTLLSHFTDKDPYWADRFHVWRVEWDKEAITISVDGELLNKGRLKDMMNGGHYRGRNPFMHPHRLRINLALRDKKYDKVDPHLLPYKMQVDYVRYYVKK